MIIRLLSVLLAVVALVGCGDVKQLDHSWLHAPPGPRPLPRTGGAVAERPAVEGL